MKKSKNSRNRSNVWQYKVLNEVRVKPALYYGRNVGHGKYMAAQAESGELICKDGVPIPYESI